MPGTFVVDETGIVRFAHRNRHVADPPRNQAILEAVERIGAAARPAPGGRVAPYTCSGMRRGRMAATTNHPTPR